MDKELINKKFQSLPFEAQKQVIDFIDFLYDKYNPKSDKMINKKSIFENKEFIGIWKDRKDLEDSSNWIRKLRSY